MRLRVWAWAVGAGWLMASLVACSSGAPVREKILGLGHEPTAERVAAQSQVESDGYRQTLVVRGPFLQGQIREGRDGAYYRTRLVGSRARNGAELFQVFVAAHLPETTANFQWAHDQEQIPLSVVKSSRDQKCSGESGCVYYERIAIRVTRAYLEARVRKGIVLSVSGSKGSAQVEIPAAYVDGFLQRLEREVASRAALAKSPDAGAKQSYCRAKYGSDAKAQRFCEQQTRASYERLSPALARARNDAFTPESRLVERCLGRHTGSLGVDWMMVEHCYRKARESQRIGPASR